jgi:hypothetical protein
MEGDPHHCHPGNGGSVAPCRISIVLEADLQSPDASWEKTDTEGGSGSDFQDGCGELDLGSTAHPCMLDYLIYSVIASCVNSILVICGGNCSTRLQTNAPAEDLFMRVKKFVLVVAILPLLWAGFKVSEARNVRWFILNASGAKDPVMCNGTEMTRADCYLLVVTKNNTSAITYFLINLDFGFLWIVLYILAGLAGVVASFWLLALQVTAVSDFDWNQILFRFLLGAVSGFICYLLVKLSTLLGSGGSAVLATGALGNRSANTYAMYESLEAFPMLAGLFLSTFFEELKGILIKVMNWVKSPHTTGSGG